MSTQLSINPVRVAQEFALVTPRDGGRGSAARMDGSVASVAWSGTHVTVGGINVFPLWYAPENLDFAFDQLDRPQICWINPTDNSAYIYFYNGLISNYDTLSLGVSAQAVAICNDYLLEGGVNTVLVYLNNGYPSYRLQSDRFTVEYQLLSSRQACGIKAFGIGKSTNSIQIIVGL